IFEVEAGSSLPQLTLTELNRQIAEANERINVQYLTPDTKTSDYDENAIPSVDLFATDSDGNEIWNPLRNRQFDWTTGTLVGPAEEYDAMTQQKINQYQNSSDGKDNPFDRYGNLLPLVGNGKFFEDWGGYEKPFMINDHVFPNGPLTIAQLGTMEEWRLRNWSVVAPAKYTGHPFHIHVNDYQVKDSDTELGDKRNLEDVTMLNSSGYEYYDTATGGTKSQEPFRGEFHGIDEALDPAKVSQLATFGANDQTIRMLFQDYIGSYVYHCHILPHEDAGMMQAITVVENTDSSWLLSAEGFEKSDGNVKLYQAQDYSSRDLDVGINSEQEVVRSSVGDLTSDFQQDVLLSIESNKGFGEVKVFDGSSLLDDTTTELSSFSPYTSGHAPWVFAEDFDGDGARDIVTAGFDSDQSNSIELSELSAKFWSSKSDGQDWDQVFDFNPFAQGLLPDSKQDFLAQSVNNLQESQISVAMADMNLDNFQDVVISYAVDGGFRIVVYDGAALSLSYSTGLDEGGYFPDKNVLADAIFQDNSLDNLNSIVLTSGFNDFYQAPLENLLVTTVSDSGSKQFTFQLNAGHFIATALDETLTPASNESGMHSGDMSMSAAGQSAGGHAGHGMVMPVDPRVTNIQDSVAPIFLTGESSLLDSGDIPTPFIAGALGNGVLVQDGKLSIAQGNGVNGNESSSDELFNTSQQVYLSLDGLLKANADDLTGAVDPRFNEVSAFDDPGVQALVRESFDEILNPSQFDERNNLAFLTYRAYTGGIIDPSRLSSLSGGVLGQDGSSSDLVKALTGDFAESRYYQKVNDFFGGPIEVQSVEEIANKVSSSLFGRNSSQDELAEWSSAVDNGVSKTNLPLLILRSASGDDVYRLAALSASFAWNVAQWATSANIDGSFSQGFQPANDQFEDLNEFIGGIGPLDGWDQAQEAFSTFTNYALDELLGSPVERSGLF
ncbi:multicopper oxidase domain-containing protein, partial [bacterium]|nr:multicopper oxidase domain-containing protein [bacterium]